MVSWIVSFVAVCALASAGLSFPIIEEHQEIGIPETDTLSEWWKIEEKAGKTLMKTLGSEFERKEVDFETAEKGKWAKPKLAAQRHDEFIVGHEEILGHQIGLSQELHEFEPKHATSYQSFHLESKNAVPIVIKTVHPPTLKHFSGIGESFGHEIPEVEPIDLKLHEI